MNADVLADLWSRRRTGTALLVNQYEMHDFFYRLGGVAAVVGNRR